MSIQAGAPAAGAARRKLGRSGLEVSSIGFGGWGIGKSMWGDTDDGESLRALRAALDLGMDFFDTASVYGHGHSERLIAQAVREAGGRACVASKIPPRNMEWPANPRTRLANAFPPDWILSCTERSLRNLRTDCLELQQFHVWTDSWLKDPLWRESLEAVRSLRAQGKIRLFGVSINSDEPDSALELVRSGAVDVVQVIYNLFDQRAARRLFPLCARMGVGVVVRCPFDEGSLTGSLEPDTRFPPEDFRNFYFGGDRLGETCRRVESLRALLVGPHAASLSEAALRFCLSRAEVSSVIPGMRLKAHVESNARAAGCLPFDAALLDALRKHEWIRDYYRA